MSTPCEVATGDWRVPNPGATLNPGIAMKGPRPVQPRFALPVPAPLVQP